jgi:hypothetical protein
MSNKKCPTQDQLEKVMTCQNFNAEHLPKIQTAIAKLINTTVNVEKDGQSGGSKLVDYKQKIIDNQAEADANTVINRKTEQYNTLVNNINDKINHLDILKEYTKNLDNLEKYYEKNKNSDEEEIQEIISKNEINNRMAQYYEEQDEKVNTIMHYTKFFYWTVIVSVLCILLWVSYKFGYLTAVGKYIKNNIKKLKNKIVPTKDMKDAVGEKIKKRIDEAQKELIDAKRNGGENKDALINDAKTKLREANKEYEEHLIHIAKKQYKPQEAKELTKDQKDKANTAVANSNKIVDKEKQQRLNRLKDSIGRKEAEIKKLEEENPQRPKTKEKIEELKKDISKDQRFIDGKARVIDPEKLEKDDEMREPRHKALKLPSVQYAGAKMDLRSAGILDAIQNKAKDKKTAVSFLQDKIPEQCETLKPEYLKQNMTTTEEQKCREGKKTLNECQSKNYCSTNHPDDIYKQENCKRKNLKKYELYKKCIERFNKDGKDEVKEDTSPSSTWEKNIFGNWSKKSTSKTSKDISQGIKQTQKNITSGVTEVKKTAQKVIRSPKFYLGILLSLIIIPSLIVPVGVPIFDFITYYLFPNTSPF